MEAGTFIGYQVVLRAADDRVLAPDSYTRRRLAATMLEVGRDFGLLAFGAADTHIHSLAICDRVAAGRLAQSLQAALRPALRLPVPFEPARLTPIEGQSHLVACFPYVLRNARKHGILDPCASEGSSVHDLLGLRRTAPWLRDRVRATLPRLTRRDLLPILGVRDLGGSGALGPDLADAAAATFALPDLRGRSDLVVRGRVAALALVRLVWTPAAIAEVLHITERTVHRLGERPPDPADVEALRRQLAWRHAIHGQLLTSQPF